MEEITATFRVVTPMFVSGADQSKAELRLPSIKGVLRFWWRTLAWERLNGDLNVIREEEAKLFGSTDKGQSAVLMKLSDQDIKTAKQEKWSPNRWEAYVGYGLIETTGGNQRDYIKPGSTFTLSFKSKDLLDDDDRTNLRKALLVFGLLGGLGGRSRKGWGSVNLTSMSCSPAWSPPAEAKELETELHALLCENDKHPSYTAVTSASEIRIGNPKKNAKEAHKYLAEHYRDTVREASDKSEREQFGLPRKSNDQRRASPVFLHVHELSDGGAIPVAAHLPAQFLNDRPYPAGGDKHIKSFLQKVAGGMS
jgi:CRISPR-associated protein Cmr1